MREFKFKIKQHQVSDFLTPTKILMSNLDRKLVDLLASSWFRARAPSASPPSVAATATSGLSPAATSGCASCSPVSRNATSRSRNTSVSLASISANRLCKAVRWANVRFRWAWRPSSATSLKWAA